MIMRPRLALLAPIALGALVGCADSPATWTIRTTTVTVSDDDHVVVDVVYVNEGDDEWGGSRCVIIEWQRGAVQTREEARQGGAVTAETLETQRWCNGKNNALEAGKRDLFKAVSAHLRSELAGSTVVVVAQDFRGTATDDRVLIASP